MDLFVYGTLMSQGLMAAVAGGETPDPISATLDGYMRQSMAGNVVPFITTGDNASTVGVLWRDLSIEQTRRLDAYEGAFGYVLEPVTVSVDGHVVDAQCYMPPAGLSSGADEWHLAAWEAEHLAPAILAAEELFSHRPLPDHGALRRMWPMIEARAWSKHRATSAPATVRHTAQTDDMRVLARRAPQGSFFRLQSVDITHRKFDASQSHVLVREAFIGVDAALVLPYDPVRDKVLLVEQARMGPTVRHDPNPWMLEPVAGIVDARETPEDAAHREAAEEANLTLQHLEPAGRFYTSPGSSTDYFYAFVGLCDLPAKSPYLGGLAEEGEDIRLHPLTFDEAMALADSGEIATGPLLFLLNWLARHRDRLRAMA